MHSLHRTAWRGYPTEKELGKYTSNSTNKNDHNTTAHKKRAEATIQLIITTRSMRSYRQWNWRLPAKLMVVYDSNSITPRRRRRRRQGGETFSSLYILAEIYWTARAWLIPQFLFEIFSSHYPFLPAITRRRTILSYLQGCSYSSFANRLVGEVENQVSKKFMPLS